MVGCFGMEVSIYMVRDRINGLVNYNPKEYPINGESLGVLRGIFYLDVPLEGS